MNQSSQPLTEEQQIREKLGDPWWRLNNLYYITDKSGHKVKFKPNWAQLFLYNNLWYLDVILKVRQVGITTFIQIFMLDRCLFGNNVSAGVIAHNREDAEDFFDKNIKFAYDNLPGWLRKEISTVGDSAKQLKFSNGSSIRVGTSLRSGTYQYLHVSEFGKICAKYPDKAEEIISGSLNTVEAGNFVFIESTAEGAYGRFYEMCKEAEQKLNDGRDLTKLCYKFFFFPWWKHPDYSMSDAVELTEDLVAYFAGLELKGIKLTNAQKYWYAAKKSVQKSKMKQEYPSTADEAFSRISEHAVYGAEFRKVREEGRITSLIVDRAKPVHTFWDLGRSKTDATSIWFMQQDGQKYHFIDFLQGFQKDVSHYVHELQDKGYIYGTHYLPHDGDTNDFDLESYKDKLKKRGITNVETVDRIPHLNLGIDSVREKLPFCWFDEDRCAEGITALEAYQYEYDEKDATYKTPRHNWASHPSDAFRQFAQGFSPNSGWGAIAPAAEDKRRQEAFKRNKWATSAGWRT